MYNLTQFFWPVNFLFGSSSFLFPFLLFPYPFFIKKFFFVKLKYFKLFLWIFLQFKSACPTANSILTLSLSFIFSLIDILPDGFINYYYYYYYISVMRNIICHYSSVFRFLSFETLDFFFCVYMCVFVCPGNVCFVGARVLLCLRVKAIFLTADPGNNILEYNPGYIPADEFNM